MVRFAGDGGGEAGKGMGSGGEGGPAANPPSEPLRPGETPLRRLERVGREVAEMAAHIDAATYRFLERLRAFDGLFAEGGGALGFPTCAAWLSWRTGIRPGTAREKVRVARALGALPRISDAMRRGRLSYSQVRSLTRVATPDNEERLLMFAEHASAAQLEILVRGWRQIDRQKEAEQERERHGRCGLTVLSDGRGSYTVRGRLDPEAGILLRKALELADEALHRGTRAEAGGGVGGEGDADVPHLHPVRQEQRWAQAIELIAEQILRVGFGAGSGGAACGCDSAACDAAGGERGPGDVADATRRPDPTALPRTIGNGDRYQVVVHVDARTLFCGGEAGEGGGEAGEGGGAQGDGGRVGDGECAFEDGGARVSAETLKRIGCDASLLTVLHGEDGHVLNVGRSARTPTARQRRALWARDRGCRFPACDHTRFLVPHHVVDWTKGGRTDLDNLALLCRTHHRAVHEGGFKMEADGAGGFRFRRPDGQLIPQVPGRPALPDGTDPMQGIRTENGSRDLEIDGWTASPASWGPFDREMGVSWMWDGGRARGEDSFARRNESHERGCPDPDRGCPDPDEGCDDRRRGRQDRDGRAEDRDRGAEDQDQA